MQATYQTKVSDKGIYPLLDAIAALCGRAERTLFVDLHVRRRALSECKREYIRNFGLTARQFNALRANLDGKVEAAREGQKNRIAHLQDAIAAAKKAAKKAERDLAKLRNKKVRAAQAAEQRHRLRFTLHQKRRRLHALQRRLAAARADHEAGRVRLCFGGKKLFHAQFHSRAAADPNLVFTALAHHLSERFLLETWQTLNKRGAAGVDGVSMEEYVANLAVNVHNLVENLKRHYYRPPDVRRVYIPKAGNPAKLRPLGIPTVEDRLLQAAVARLLGAIYEVDFLECSYGFRPGRTAHQALRDLRVEVESGRAQWIAEADIRGFFDNIDHDWMMRMLEQRIGDPWILRLIRKWLKAGILDQGQVTEPTKGTPQGGPLSPLLANIYLHYVLDLWFERVVRPRCKGEAKLIRFADDFVVLFSDERVAKGFAAALPKRLDKFGLSVAEEKTRLVPFGRKHWCKGEPYPHHFDFLGFRHHLGTSRKGRMVFIRIPSPKSVAKFLAEVKEWLRKHWHDRPQDQQRALAQKLLGLYQYFALWFATPKLRMVHHEVLKYWFWKLRRQSQTADHTWTKWERRPWFRLPEPKLLHRGV